MRKYVFPSSSIDRASGLEGVVNVFERLLSEVFVDVSEGAVRFLDVDI